MSTQVYILISTQVIITERMHTAIRYKVNVTISNILDKKPSPDYSFFHTVTSNYVKFDHRIQFPMHFMSVMI